MMNNLENQEIEERKEPIQQEDESDEEIYHDALSEGIPEQDPMLINEDLNEIELKILMTKLLEN